MSLSAMKPQRVSHPTQNVDLPNWVPVPARRYLLHTEAGISIRSLARGAGCHASTILRQVRQFENRRDDLLVDEALKDLGSSHFQMQISNSTEDRTQMSVAMRTKTDDQPSVLEVNAVRILRRLNEAGAVLVVAKELEKAVVVRDLPGGKTTRTAVVDRETAQAMALKDWISCRRKGKIAQYQITSAGQAALKRLSRQAANSQPGFEEAQTPFAEQHRVWGAKQLAKGDDRPARQIRYNIAESPIAALARRKDKNGHPYLTDDLVAAGERLREDFEVAQMGPRVAQNWDKFLTGGDRGSFTGDNRSLDGPGDARDRVSAALQALGPGLGDVALRCCCYLEGMETAERRMGWSARSGKVVLKIALQRLKDHYERTHGKYGPMIG